MSRSNVRVAHSLRREEALQTRKRILKCGGSALRQQQVANELDSSHQQQHLQRLEKFTREKKQSKKKLDQRSEWIQGGIYLVNLAQRIERDLLSVYQKLSVTMLQERDSSFYEVCNIIENNEQSRKQNQSFIMHQIHEIKGMLANVKQYNQHCRNDACESSDQRKQAIASVVANLIVQMRSSHDSAWKSLCDEERVLREQVRDSLVCFSRLQTEHRQVFNECRVLEELQHADDDNENVLAFIEEWKQRIYELDSAHLEDLNSIVIEKEKNNEICSAGNDTLGGWDESSHNIFLKVIKRSQVQGLSRQRLTASLTAELPSKNSQEISQHENWYNKIASLNERKKQKVAEYTRKREEMLTQATHEISVMRGQEKEAERARHEQEKHEIERQHMHERLNALRAERMSEMENRLAEIEKLRAKAEEDNLKTEEKTKAERDKKKMLVSKFKNDRKEALEAQRIQRENEIKIREEERKKQIQAARPHIEEREAKLRDKEAEKKKRQAQYLEEEAKRRDLLNRLAEQVPYWEAMQNASSKLDHVTASAESHRYYKPDEVSRGFLALNGFTDKKVFKDARFRLGLALREAGVHQSAAAHAMVNSMNPRAQAPW